MMTRHYIVRGVVQGVSFRAYTQQQARQLGVKGWVRNQDDGSVEILADAQPEILAKLEDWLRQGPPAARVDTLEVEEAAPQRFDGFEILY